MVLLNNTNLTLMDWAKRVDPDGRVPIVAELLSQSNEILTDCVFKEGNLPTGERVVIRTGLPTVYWRALNQGIPSSKSTTAQVDEACSILEARSEVDKDLAMLNGNTAAFRLSEDSAFLEAMNQRMATTMFYGNPATDVKEFPGLATRYSTVATTGAAPLSSANVIDAGGTGANNASVYLVVWGDQTVYCPFPKGSKAGLMMEDLGEQTVYTNASSVSERMQALVTRYQWKNGLVVKDWRYVVRICNINSTDMAGASGTQASTQSTALIRLMSKALYKIPNLSMGRACFYMNRTVHSGLAIQAMDRSQNVLNVQQSLTQFGHASSYLSFLGVPCRRVDVLKNDEARVL